MRDESDERLDKEQTWSEMMNHKAENSNTTEKDEDVILVTYYVPSIPRKKWHDNPGWKNEDPTIRDKAEMPTSLR